jgi:opacity protein-like surface antigen
MKHLLWTLILFPAFFSTRAAAQPFGVGVKLGSTLNNAITATSTLSIPDDHHFIVGPYFEVRLPFGFSAELDALHESSLYSSVVNGGSTWQFPLMAKYKLLKGPVKPYIEGGIAFSHITDLQNLPDLNHTGNFGVVLGGGVEVKLLAPRISAEIRYNGWAFKNIQSPTGLFESNQNQVSFLLGLGF